MRLCLFLVGVCAGGGGLGGGGGRPGGMGVGASCNKLHGASCNINIFINFVESVRPKKVIPYTD